MPTVAPLLNLTGVTNFNTAESEYTYVAGDQPPVQSDINAYSPPQISYDASTQSYTISSATSGYNYSYFGPANATLTTANIDSANSNATFTAYTTPTETARILNPGANNPAIQLSYVSFADITQTMPNSFTGTTYPVDYFLVFGQTTPSVSMPTTGSASYSGVVYGFGSYPSLSTGEVSVGGTGSLSVNFNGGTLSSTLNLTATPVGGGSSQSMGSFALTGSIYSGSSTFSAGGSFAGGGAGMRGSFYGPSANEVGAAFRVNATSATASTTGPFNVVGAFVGKKN